MARAASLALFLVVPALVGCLSASEPLVDTSATGAAAGWIPEDVVWDVESNFSRPLKGIGPFDVLPVERLDLPGVGGANIATSVWRPDVPEGTQVPVILQISPYFGGGLENANGGWAKEFFLDNFVTNGYAYGRVAVRGTSFSGGCMEFFGAKEQADIVAAVNMFGEAAWSNGRIAIIGGSYDGTTPWIAAASSPYVATIVPISGLTDVAGLMYRNGTSENRGLFMSMLYWTSSGNPTREQSPTLAENFCPEVPVGAFVHGYSGATGDRTTPPVDSDYWAIRDWREPVLANYEGSVYLVHGMQDWNVEPTMAFPYMQELIDAGVPVKMMLGQWGHAIPDSKSREEHVRFDWAELLTRWFDQELKGIQGIAQGPNVDIEDNMGYWRTEETWPPQDAMPWELHLGDGVLSPEPTSRGSAMGLNPAGVFHNENVPVDVPVREWTFRLGALEEDLRFAGLPQLHITVVPSSPGGGNLFAEVLSVGGGASERVAHGVMDLQYYAGGNEMHVLTPGEPILALMELFPADVLVPAGHELVLRIVPETALGAGVVPHTSPAPIELVWGDGASILRLPVIERDVGDGMYAGQVDAEQRAYEEDEGGAA